MSISANERRRVFLEKTKEELYAPRETDCAGRGHGTPNAPSVGSGRTLKQLASIGAAAAATVGALAAIAPPASASVTPSAASGIHKDTAILCDTNVRAEPRTQSYWCGLANWVYNFQYEYGTPSGSACDVFDLWIYGNCAGTVHVGQKVACRVGFDRGASTHSA